MRHIAVFGLAGTGWFFLGQTDIGPWQELLGHTGIVGVLMWYLWFTNTTTLPKLTKDFKEEAEKQREESKRQREHYEVCMDKMIQEMATGREAITELRVQCEKRE